MDTINPFDIVSAIGSGIAGVAALIAVWVAFCQLRQISLTSKAEEMRARDEYFNGKAFLKARLAAALALQSEPSDQIEDVLDFFGTIGMLVRKKALDEEMAWHTFFHWVRGYWQAAKGYIREKQLSEPPVWKDFEWLYKKLMRREARECKKSDLELILSREGMELFLNQEIGSCKEF